MTGDTHDVLAPGDRTTVRRAHAESPDAYDAIRRDVLHVIERRRLRPDRDLTEVRAEVQRAVDDHQRRAQRGEGRRLADPGALVERVVRSIADLGPLTDLLAVPTSRRCSSTEPASRTSTATVRCGDSPSRRTRRRTAGWSSGC